MRFNSKATYWFVGFIFCFGWHGTLFGQEDWGQWRGPDRDGVIPAGLTPQSWPEKLSREWTVDVGSGYATPLVINGEIFLFTRQAGEEVMLAINPNSGGINWRSGYAAPFEINPSTNPHGPGPKATPAYADGRLFTLGMSGIVTGFDASDGTIIWQTSASTVHPLFHTAMSPIVDGDAVIVHVGGHDDGALTAFDVRSGQVKWEWAGDGPAYGSPVVLDVEGSRQVITYTQKNLIGVDVVSGRLLWRRPFVTEYTTTSQTPIRHGEVFLQAGRGNGITAFRVIREGDAWTTEDVWHTSEASLHMTNGVITDSMLVGLSHLNSGQYFGLDLVTGDVLWRGSPRQAENASILSVGENIISLQDDAVLLILEASRTGFEIRQQYDVAESATWTQPTVSGNRIFIKDISNLTLWTLD